MKTFITFDQILEEIKNRQDIIKELNKFEKVLVVTRGGLVVAGLLSQYLDTRWYDTACIKSYSNNKEQTDFEIIKLNPSNEKILIIEDIVDTGDTAKFLKEKFPNSSLFSLHYKPHSKYKPDFYFWETTDWIVYPWEKD